MLLTIAEFARKISKHPSQIYTMVNKQGMPFTEERNEKGKLVKMIDPEQAEAWLAERQATIKQRRKARSSKQPPKPGETLEPQHTFEEDSRFIIWNRGGDRGWAADAVEEVEFDEFGMIEPDGRDVAQHERYTWLKLVSSYGKRYDLHAGVLRDRIVAGHVYFKDPIQLIGFVVLQLLRFRGDAPKEAIRHLEAAAAELRKWKEERENERQSSN